jgi:hypothetical protein
MMAFRYKWEVITKVKTEIKLLQNFATAPWICQLTEIGTANSSIRLAKILMAG